MNNSKLIHKNYSQPALLKRPLEDLSNLANNNSTLLNEKVNTKQLKQSRYRTMQNSKQLEALPSMKFRIVMNQFNEDHYIFKLQLHPKTTMKDVANYFFQYPAFQQLKNKGLQIFDQTEKEIREIKDFQIHGTFVFGKTKIQPQFTVKQVIELIQQSRSGIDFIDFSFMYVQKIKEKLPINQQKPIKVDAQQHCCLIM